MQDTVATNSTNSEQQYRVKLREWRMFKNKKRLSAKMSVPSSEQSTAFQTVERYDRNLIPPSNIFSTDDIGLVSSLALFPAPNDLDLADFLSVSHPFLQSSYRDRRADIMPLWAAVYI